RVSAGETERSRELRRRIDRHLRRQPPKAAVRDVANANRIAAVNPVLSARDGMPAKHSAVSRGIRRRRAVDEGPPQIGEKNVRFCRLLAINPGIAIGKQLGSGACWPRVKICLVFSNSSFNYPPAR